MGKWVFGQSTCLYVNAYWDTTATVSKQGEAWPTQYT